MGFWNLSRVCGFCCFKTIFLLLIFVDRGGGGGGGGAHTLGQVLWMSDPLGACIKD